LDKNFSLVRVIKSILKLKVNLVSLFILSLELLSSFIKFNLSSLGLSNFMLKLLGFPCHLNGKFLDLKGKFLDFSLISSSILFESEVIFFLLPGSEGPLFQFLLVPVHLELVLVHFLISFEN